LLGAADITRETYPVFNAFLDYRPVNRFEIPAPSSCKHETVRKSLADQPGEGPHEAIDVLAGFERAKVENEVVGEVVAGPE
jgi:hypothetical protein